MRLVQTLHRTFGRLEERHDLSLGLKLSLAYQGHLWSLANAAMTAVLRSTN
jgi:hypothetical protein